MKRILCFIMVAAMAASLWANGSQPAAGQSGPVTLDYWLPISNEAVRFIQTYAENEAYQEVQKRLGINVNFIHPAAGAELQAFNLMMASGDLPDMIQTSNRYSGGVMKAVDDGIYLELSDKVEQYAPDYFREINATPAMHREAYDENGHLGAFYRIQMAYDPVPDRPITRKDWLEEFNMKPPKTFAEYEGFFDAVKQKHPEAEPFAYPANQPAGVNILYGAFNIFPNWFVTDGKVRHGNADPVLRDYLTLMRDWHSKGYIFKDFASTTPQQMWSLFDTNKIGMYLHTVDGSRTRTANLPFKIESCPLPRPEADSKLHLVYNPTRIGGDETSIAASSKNWEAAMKFLNYGYNPEGHMILNYGIEGKSYNMVDGQPVYTDYMLNHPVYSTVNANYILRVHFAPKLFPGMMANPTVIKSPEGLAFRKQWSGDPNEDGVYFLPRITLTSTENTRRAEIMANVNTYTDEMILKFIIGTEPLSNFDRYIAQINQYGMPEALAITQAAYDRYMSK